MVEGVESEKTPRMRRVPEVLPARIAFSAPWHAATTLFSFNSPVRVGLFHSCQKPEGTGQHCGTNHHLYVCFVSFYSAVCDATERHQVSLVISVLGCVELQISDL